MSTNTTVSTLRQRMIEDMTARKLGLHSQRSHIHSCRRFAAFLKRSPDTATAADVRRLQLHLVEAGLFEAQLQPIFGGPGRNCAPSVSRPAPGTKFPSSLIPSGSSNSME